MAGTAIAPLPRRSQLPHARALAGGIIVIVLVGLLGMTGVLTRARNLVPGLKTTTPAYQTTTVATGNVVVGVTATGPVAAVNDLPLTFKTSGKLAELDVQAGAHVTKGQVLAKLDTADLQTALDQAKATLAQAQANLQKVQAGATKEAVAVAQTSVDNARTSVTNARASVATSKATAANNVAAAQDGVHTAAVNLATAQDTLQAAQDQEARALAADQTSITNAQKNLDAVKATVAADGPIQQQNVEKAKDSLWAAQISRDATCGRSQGSDCQAANANVAAAQTALNAAVAQAAQSATQDQQTIAAAQTAVDQAQAQLASDKAKDDAAVVSAQNQVKAAQAAVASAQTALTQAQAQATATIQNAQAQVDSAQGTLQAAQASYNQTVAPATAADLATAQAQVVNAQAAVESARNNLDAAVLTAPFDGVVAAVNGAVGQQVTGGPVNANSSVSPSALITLVDLSNLQVTAQVNEADIAKVKVGDPVSFTVSAFPTTTFNGKVLGIQPIGTTTQNVVNYTVTTSIQSTKDATLYPGMTATATIVSAERENVLTVPAAALTFAQTAIRQGLVQLPSGKSGPLSSPGAGAPTVSASTGTNAAATASQSYVVTLSQGKLTLVPVTTGLSDGSTTEVASGVRAGNTIVTGQTGSTTGRSTGSSTSRSSNPLSSGPPGP